MHARVFQQSIAPFSCVSSNPTVRVPLFGSIYSGQWSSSSKKILYYGWYDTCTTDNSGTVYFEAFVVRSLAHKNFCLVARTKLVRRHVSGGKILSSFMRGAQKQGTTPTGAWSWQRCGNTGQRYMYTTLPENFQERLGVLNPHTTEKISYTNSK